MAKSKKNITKPQRNLPPLPPTQRNVTTRTVTQQVEWVYPLPPPDLFKKYNDAVPDGAERLLKMVENQSQHRIQMEERAVEGGLKNRDRGQIFAFIICVLALGGGIFLIHTNKNVSGLVIILGALGGIVSTFIIGSKGQKMKKEPEIKGSTN